MITRQWQNTTLVCEICDEEMPLSTYGKLEYRCPKCKNFMTINHFERLLEKISELEDEKLEKREIGGILEEKIVIAKKIKCKIITDGENGVYRVMVNNLGKKF